MSDNYAPPNPYAAPLATLRAAATPDTPLQAFERLYQYRLRETLAVGAAETEAFNRDARAAAERLGVPVHELRVAQDNDDATYPAPDGYALALQREKERR